MGPERAMAEWAERVGGQRAMAEGGEGGGSACNSLGRWGHEAMGPENHEEQWKWAERVGGVEEVGMPWSPQPFKLGFEPLVEGWAMGPWYPGALGP